MALIGYSPWTDAAAYGQGLGQALSQGLLQLPQQRYALAVQLAQMKQAEANKQAMLGLMAQREQGLENYRNQTIDWRQQEAANQQQAHNLANQIGLMRAQIAMAQANRPSIEGGYLIPGANFGGTNNSAGLSGGTNNLQQMAGPSGITPMPNPSAVHTSQPANATALNAVANMMSQFMGSPGAITNYPAIWQQTTNAYPQLLGRFTQDGGLPATNSVPQVSQQQKVLKYNPTTGMVE